MINLARDATRTLAEQTRRGVAADVVIGRSPSNRVKVSVASTGRFVGIEINTELLRRVDSLTMSRECSAAFVDAFRRHASAAAARDRPMEELNLRVAELRSRLGF